MDKAIAKNLLKNLTCEKCKFRCLYGESYEYIKRQSIPKIYTCEKFKPLDGTILYKMHKEEIRPFNDKKIVFDIVNERCIKKAEIYNQANELIIVYNFDDGPYTFTKAGGTFTLNFSASNNIMPS